MNHDVYETQYLYKKVRERYEASSYSRDGARAQLAVKLARRLDTSLRLTFAGVIDGILYFEDPIFGFPELDISSLTLSERVELRRYLKAKEYFLDNESRILSMLEGGVVSMLSHIASQLPSASEESPFTVPVFSALPNPKKAIDDIFRFMWTKEYMRAGLFVGLSRQLYFNYCAACNKNPDDTKPLLMAEESRLSPEEAVRTYLRETPLKDFFEDMIPLELTYETRFSHMHILGGSGAGKTQLLQSLILNDLQSDDPPSIVVIDSQGDLIGNLLRVAPDPLIITPRDIYNPPALNVFDLKDRGYDHIRKEQVIAGAIQTFDYLFAGLFGADLTAKQGVFFRFIARLMLAVPEGLGRNATIIDMLRLMEDSTPYLDAIKRLPYIQQQFFDRDFESKTFSQTREQLRYRLQAILENPTLARLFTSLETKIDLFSELNKGSFILVDTAKDFLKSASPHFGRIFISLILQAILERAAIPEHKRRPTFLIVDEAAQYFDQNIDDLLTEARKYKLGCIFAHQFLDQCTPQLRASLMANTAIKLAGSVSAQDARSMASEMRTTPDFIHNQKKLHFACYIRNITPNAVSVPVQAGKLESLPRLSSEKYDLLIARNRERVSSSDLMLTERIERDDSGEDSYD